MNFEEIYNRYFRKVYAFAYSLSQDAHLAEEITQDTFFRALQHPDQFEGRSSVDSYLCSIAHNRYISILRSRKKTRRRKRWKPFRPARTSRRTMSGRM